jgi:hypothetical protein
VSEYHAVEILRINGDQDPRRTLGTLPDSPARRCMASTLLPYVSPTTGESQRGRSCKGCQVAMEADMSDGNFSRRERVYSRRRISTSLSGLH